MTENNKFEMLLKNWLKKFHQYKIAYRNGIYHLNCLINSPYTIVESLISLPFSKADREKQIIQINTIFSKSDISYSNPEEGLWILNYDNFYKKNLLIKNISDKEIPMEYNYIHFLSTEGSLDSKPMIVNGVTIKNNMWSMAKIGQPSNSFHYKNTCEKSTLVFFTLTWLKKNNFYSGTIKHFFESKGKHIIIHNSEKVKEDFYTMFQFLFTNKEDNQSKIIDSSKRFIQLFSYIIEEQNLSENHFLLPDNDWDMILKAERILKEYLFKDFPGIEYIASKLSVSPTKLKNDFKLVHLKTIYHYFQEQQMKIAHELLSKKNIKIKDIATLLCYENASKFSMVFKKYYGVLPSLIND
jgi:AraC-like DNA-binding protein